MASHSAINEVFFRCRSQLARVISRIVPPEEIEDIVQETYVRVVQFRSRGEIRQPRAFMVRTARNLALNHVTRAEVTRTSTFADESDLELDRRDDLRDPTLSQASSDMEFVQFCEVVRQLPQQCRRVFVLKKVYGYSYREIATLLKISESTVQKHVAKGMHRCVKALERSEPAPVEGSHASGITKGTSS